MPFHPEEPQAGFVRYEGSERNARGIHPGIFGLANALARDGRLSETDHSWWLASNLWYDAAYINPQLVDASVYDRTLNPTAQAWFKVSAAHLLERIPGYLALLDRYAVPWREVRSTDPGTVLYEDEFQLVVTPWSTRSGTAGGPEALLEAQRTQVKAAKELPTAREPL
ncbi:MAG: hypothetical protein AVDCRST_MAG83-3697 [uncultured Arthrobacter sp.]|uniref:Uncharacterized protein n=1 Tax=uncultured Arthrobacter sp. TaxID=114050 RepID=A0A6J4JJ58_9MICC|nr:hypothetical protein [uncultured Arthrobacter sp.]CAA9278768.1 MAG: hypothetical protein AVDCRST_MAG83-3697 [uncultured Arthrobacter sp.]